MQSPETRSHAHFAAPSSATPAKAARADGAPTSSPVPALPPASEQPEAPAPPTAEALLASLIPDPPAPPPPRPAIPASARVAATSFRAAQANSPGPAEPAASAPATATTITDAGANKADGSEGGEVSVDEKLLTVLRELLAGSGNGHASVIATGVTNAAPTARAEPEAPTAAEPLPLTPATVPPEPPAKSATSLFVSESPVMPHLREVGRRARVGLTVVLVATNLLTLLVLAICLTLAMTGGLAANTLGPGSESAAANDEQAAEFAALRDRYLDATDTDGGSNLGDGRLDSSLSRPIVGPGGERPGSSGVIGGDNYTAPQPPPSAVPGSMAARWFVQWIFYRERASGREAVVSPFPSTGLAARMKSLSIGDSLDGTVVVDITPRTVVFERPGGAREVIVTDGVEGNGEDVIDLQELLGDDDAGGDADASDTGNPLAGTGQDDDDEAITPIPDGDGDSGNEDPDPAGEAIPSERIVSHLLGATTLRALLSDPLDLVYHHDEVLTESALGPGGVIEGLKLVYLPDDCFLTLHGFEFNDVLVKLNDVTIISPSDVSAFAADGGFAADFSITFRRNGELWCTSFAVRPSFLPGGND